MPDLSRHVIVVTGATGNLGHTFVRRAIESGAHVACPVRDLAKGEALRAELGGLAVDAADPRLLVRELDLNDQRAMEAFVETVLRAWGRVDAIVNLAGTFGNGPATDLAKIEELWGANVRPAIVATAACLRPMRARGRGRVVSVGALSALKAGANVAGYAMAKGALVRWTEALAQELKAGGITANVVLPSTIDHPTNRKNMPKADPATWVTPDELSSVILFLCSDEASGVTGAAIPVTART
ncbi:MAG: SDR family NAD(P)-dependent oxidoreductase [Chloroflexi bacterium]|nr:SDR family NAD(P)-dependent oxidoreductase [Chloroflexota bacterium]